MTWKPYAEDHSKILAMSKNDQQKILKDHSRFNRWVSNLDEKDKSLTPLVRKSKWVLIMVAVFVLFRLSFIVAPVAKINSESVEAPGDVSESTLTQLPVQSAFELPVDSFENQLKHIIHEGIPEKE